MGPGVRVGEEGGSVKLIDWSKYPKLDQFVHLPNSSTDQMAHMEELLAFAEEAVADIHKADDPTIRLNKLGDFLCDVAKTFDDAHANDAVLKASLLLHETATRIRGGTI